MNKSVKVFDGIYHQYTPEKYLHQLDAYMVFAMGEQTLDPVADNRWHKKQKL